MISSMELDAYTNLKIAGLEQLVYCWVHISGLITELNCSKNIKLSVWLEEQFSSCVGADDRQRLSEDLCGNSDWLQ